MDLRMNLALELQVRCLTSLAIRAEDGFCANFWFYVFGESISHLVVKSAIASTLPQGWAYALRDLVLGL